MTDIPAEHMRLIKCVAYRLAARLPSSVEVDDLIAAGVVGYLESAPRWDPLRGSFETFIEFRVKGAMLDEIRALDAAPRSLRHRQKKINGAERTLGARLGRAPTREEIAHELGLSLEQVEEALLPHNTVSLDSTGDPGDIPPVERLVDDATGAEETDFLVDTLRLAGKLDRALSALSPRDEAVIRAYFYDDRSELEIGRAFEVSEARVSQVVKKTLKRLKGILDDLDRADALLASVRPALIPPRAVAEEESDDLDAALGALIDELS